MRRAIAMVTVSLLAGTAYAQTPRVRDAPAPSLCSSAIQLPAQPVAAGAANLFRAPPGPVDLSTAIKVDRLRDDLYLIHNTQNVLAAIGQFGSNVGVYLTDAGVILIDSKNAGMHDFLVSQVRKLSDQPIRYLVLTHSHPDHSGGAALLQQMGVTVVISSEDRALLEEDSHPAVLPQVAYHGSLQFYLGGKEVDLREVCGHTAGDSIVSLPADRAVFVGDLVTTPDTLPQIVAYGDDGNWADELRAMDVLANMDFDMMIPGHGPVLTKAEFLRQRARMAGVYDTVRTMTRQGRSEQEILQATIRHYHYGNLNGAAQVRGMIQEARQSRQ